MRRTPLVGFVLWMTLLAGAVPIAAAQNVALTSRGPRFLVAAEGAGAPPVEISATSSAILRRVVSLNLERPTVGGVLRAIERQTGLRFFYAREVLPAERPVSLRADSISVAAALMEILVDAEVDVLLTPGRRVGLVRREAVKKAEPGDIVGQVTNVKTGEPLLGAEVLLVGTRWRTATGEDGRYRLTDVEAGNYTLAVRRIGYRQQSQPVTVVAEREVTVDMALEAIPTQLDEVVTTVTGEQRLRELGHVVGRINADSLVREAPVSNVTDLLTARVPGLQVFTTSGTVGGSASLRVRGTNTIYLNTQPIVIVDGVRYASGTAEGDQGPFGVEPTSRLNDLNPNDIASIEVVKGPSAATLYGTDAANGVIVITTKRGRPGPSRWNVYARTAISEMPGYRYPDGYWGWGTATSNCTLRNVTRGWCTQDSVTVMPSPLNDPALSMLGSKPRWEYGANVSGGSQDLRYFFSADFEDATGPVQLPPAMVPELKELLGGEIPEGYLEPNALTKLNLRTNVGTQLGKTAELQVHAGYTQSSTRQFALQGPFNVGPNQMRPDRGPYGTYSPITSFSETSTERVNRFFGSTQGQWQPWTWLRARATLGVDLTSSHRYSLAPRSIWADREGTVGDDRTRILVTTADLGATATTRFGRWSSRTSVGAQYVRSLNDAMTATGRDLPPGGASILEAANVTNYQRYTETVTLGSYLEQVFGFNDRLFLTAALRADGASTFGSDYTAAIYPKAGVSWIVSEEPWLPRLPGLDELRLRYAFGAAGQQPTSAMRRVDFAADQDVIDGERQNTVILERLANPDLRPERVLEHEFGFDATGLGGRLRLDLTWNRRRTVDQIGLVDLPVGFGNMWTNVGLVTGRGFEAQLTARLLDTRLVSWDVMLNHASNTDEVVDLGGMPRFYSYRGGWVEGYPLGARFSVPMVGYEDANGDGIIAPDEVQLGDTAVYVGRNTPGNTQALTAVLGLFDQRIRFSALIERRGDFVQFNELRRRQCRVCREKVDPTTPLAEQAAMAASGGAPAWQRQAGYTSLLEPGDFTRLREVSVAFDLPDRWARAARLSRATLSLSGRNLGLWTSYSGPDPESASFSGVIGAAADYVPQARTWVLRLDIGL